MQSVLGEGYFVRWRYASSGVIDRVAATPLAPTPRSGMAGRRIAAARIEGALGFCAPRRYPS
jgi:hypothetical protein